MTSRAVWAVGVGQCVSWGVLYYAFGVLMVPIERDLSAARWVVAGAFSLALLVSAFTSPNSRGAGERLTKSANAPAMARVATAANAMTRA